MAVSSGGDSAPRPMGHRLSDSMQSYGTARCVTLYSTRLDTHLGFLLVYVLSPATCVMMRAHALCQYRPFDVAERLESLGRMLLVPP